MINNHLLRKRYTSLLVGAILIVSILFPSATPVAYAQSVPAACRDDTGNLVRPTLVEGAWALVVNFNHVPSATVTKACVVRTVGLSPAQFSYSLFDCQLMNNIKSVNVGNGNAPFDGNFWITCPSPKGPPVPGTGQLYDSLSVRALMQIPQSNPGSNYTLLQHQDFGFRVNVQSATEMKLQSQLGALLYETSHSNIDLATLPVRLVSRMSTLNGRHEINATLFSFSVPVSSFPFNQSLPIQIGSPGKPWVLHEWVFDPPPPRSGI